jgi:hypothetical protein
VRRLLWILLLASCAKRAEVSPMETALRDELRQLDVLWERRGDVGLAPLGEHLEGLERGLRRDPRVAWREVRWLVSLGVAEDDGVVARRHWARGRGLGLTCYEGRSLGEHDPSDRTRCGAWASLAWARWVEDMGARAAAVDMDELDELVAAVSRAGERDVAEWASLLAEVARHERGHVPPAVVGRWARMVDQSEAGNREDTWIRWADFARISRERAGPHRPSGKPQTPEARAAVARLQEQGGL